VLRQRLDNVQRAILSLFSRNPFSNKGKSRVICTDIVTPQYHEAQWLDTVVNLNQQDTRINGASKAEKKKKQIKGVGIGS